MRELIIVHPSLAGLSGFAIFVAVTSILLSLFMVLVPVVYDKYNKLVRLARALQELRVSFILAATGVTELILIRCAKSFDIIIVYPD